MPCRSIVLMVSILSLFFGIVYAYRARTYSVVTSFGVLVDSTQGHKTTLLPLYRPFLWDYIRPALYSFRLKKQTNKENHVILMAWIDEISNAVQLNGFFGKSFFFLICFLRVQLYLCIYLFLYLSIYIFYLTNFQRWIFFKVLAWTVREL